MLVKKKTSCISNKSQSKPDNEHKAYLVDFFRWETVSRYSSRSRELDKKSLEGLEIKKSRVTEFMKEKCKLGIKVVTRHPVARINNTTLGARAQFVKEWLQKGMLYIQTTSFLINQASI